MMDFSRGFLPLLIILLSIKCGETRKRQCPNLVDHLCRCAMEGYFAIVQCDFYNSSIVLDGIKKLTTSRIDGIYLRSYEIDELPSGLFENVTLFQIGFETPKLRVMQTGFLGEKSALNLLILRIYSSNLSKIPVDVLKLTKNLEKLTIQYTAFENIEKDIFTGMECSQTLTELRFNQDKISMVEKGAFKTLTNLKYVNLADNKLQSLSADIFGDNIGKLTLVALGGNMLTSLPSDLIANMSTYSRINIDQNHVTTISKADLNTIVKNKVFVIANDNDLICNCDFEIIAKQNEMKVWLLGGMCSNSSQTFLANRQITKLNTKDFVQCHVDSKNV